MHQHNRPLTIPHVNALPPATPTPVLVRLIAQYRKLRASTGIPHALRSYAAAMDTAIDRELVDRARQSFGDRATRREAA